MNDVATLEVDLADAILSKRSQSVTGRIWLSVGGTTFPDSNWVDFPVVVARWWAEATALVLAGAAPVATARFMDGPYRVDIRRLSAQEWQLGLVESTLVGDTIKGSVTVDPAQFTRSVLASAAAIVSECRARNWGGDDLERLSAVAARLAELQPS